MSDFINIRVTERELELIMELLTEAGDRMDADGQPAFELLHDLMEQSGDIVEEFNEMPSGTTFTVPDEHVIKHESRAEQVASLHARGGTLAPIHRSGGSMAAIRRSEALGRSAPKMSATQRHDLFDSPTEEREIRQAASRKLCGNDPVDW
jgi:hypothetical protein